VHFVAEVYVSRPGGVHFVSEVRVGKPRLGGRTSFAGVPAGGIYTRRMNDLAPRLSTDDPYGDPGRPSSPQPQPERSPQRTAVLERELVEEQLIEPGDHERFAHYVRKEKILESALSGEPVIALCGKVWVPGRDPNRFPICPTCKEIYSGLRGPKDGGE
jgi:hypothetical protein